MKGAQPAALGRASALKFITVCPAPSSLLNTGPEQVTQPLVQQAGPHTPLLPAWVHTRHTEASPPAARVGSAGRGESSQD